MSENSELTVTLPQASMDHFDAICAKSESTPEEAFSGAMQLFEAAINLATEHPAGTVFLVVKDSSDNVLVEKRALSAH